MILTWVRIGVCAAIAAAGVAGVLAVRSHWIGVGEQRVQAKWDKQTADNVKRELQLAIQYADDQDQRDREAERTAHEDHQRELARTKRLADAQRTAAGLRDAIAKLDSDDLSAAAEDPRVAAIAQRAIAARGLLGRCAARYTELAGRAARLRDQAAGLRDFALNVCHAGSPETGAAQ